MWYVLGRGEVHTGFWWGSLREVYYLEGLGIDKIILESILKIGWKGMEWIDLAHYREKWCAVMNALMNLWVLLKIGNFLVAAE